MLKTWLQRRAGTSLPAPIVIAPSQHFDGNDGPWSSFNIEIGTPPQTVGVLPSTKSAQTFAISPLGCTSLDASNCSDARGGVFNPNTSSSWTVNQDISGGYYPLELETDLNVTGTGLYGYDTVAFAGGSPSLTQQVVGSVATKAFFLGLFGLNPYSSPLPSTTAQLPTYLSTLNQSSLIPSMSWSYTAGNQYRSGPAYGSLILGGYDTSRFESNDILFPFNDTSAGEFVVNIGSTILNNNSGPLTLETPNESLPVRIDSTTPYIILPDTIYTSFEDAFGLVWDDGVGAYLVNDTLHDSLQKQDISVIFNLGNSSTKPGQGFNLTLPYSAFDLIAGPPLLNKAGRYFPLMRAANESQYVLGRTFLQEAYMTVDYERKNFSISQCTWNSGIQAHVVSITRPGASTAPNKSGGLSGGAIAGIVIGAIAALVIAALAGVILWRRRQRSKQAKTSEKPVGDHKHTPSAELDSPYTDPYGMVGKQGDEGHPHSPELETTVHKGHELAGSGPQDEVGPYFTPLAVPQEHPIELPATERRSRMLSSLSSMSQRSDAPRMHQRNPSDPISDISSLPRSPTAPQRSLSHSSTAVPQANAAETVSPTSEQPDSPPGHSRNTSDTTSS